MSGRAGARRARHGARRRPGAGSAPRCRARARRADTAATRSTLRDAHSSAATRLDAVCTAGTRHPPVALGLGVGRSRSRLPRVGTGCARSTGTDGDDVTATAMAVVLSMVLALSHRANHPIVVVGTTPDDRRVTSSSRDFPISPDGATSTTRETGGGCSRDSAHLLDEGGSAVVIVSRSAPTHHRRRRRVHASRTRRDRPGLRILDACRPSAPVPEPRRTRRRRRYGRRRHHHRPPCGRPPRHGRHRSADGTQLRIVHTVRGAHRRGHGPPSLVSTVRVRPGTVPARTPPRTQAARVAPFASRSTSRRQQ